MRRVYRVENANGHGPYACFDDTGFAFQDEMQKLGKDHDLSYRHPVAYPRCDGASFGFACMMQLTQWFNYFGQHGYDVLRDNGFKIVVYEVPYDDCEDADAQVMFSKWTSTMVFEEDFPDV
jgi:hypothetical protein